MGDGEKLLTYLNSELKVLLGLDIFPRVPKKKKLNFFLVQLLVQLNRVVDDGILLHGYTVHQQC